MRPLVRMVCESEDDWTDDAHPHPPTTVAECDFCAGDVWLDVDEQKVKSLEFCIDRLVHVYDESPNVDFILRAREALASMRNET